MGMQSTDQISELMERPGRSFFTLFIFCMTTQYLTPLGDADISKSKAGFLPDVELPFTLTLGLPLSRSVRNKLFVNSLVWGTFPQLDY